MLGHSPADPAKAALVVMTGQTPLNRAVDAMHPESEVFRRFSVCVNQHVASSCQDGAKAADLPVQLSQWAENDGCLEPLAQHAVLAKHAAPASVAFLQAAELALTALERISQEPPLPEALKKQQIDALDAVELQAQVSVDHVHKRRIPETNRSGEHRRGLHDRDRDFCK